MFVFDAAIDWLAHGLLAASWWQIVLYALVTTHITIASVTIYLHQTDGFFAAVWQKS